MYRQSQQNESVGTAVEKEAKGIVDSGKGVVKETGKTVEKAVN